MYQYLHLLGFVWNKRTGIDATLSLKSVTIGETLDCGLRVVLMTKIAFSGTATMLRTAAIGIRTF